jgi:lipopolysaccharide biosynthesis regulator YciM
MTEDDLNDILSTARNRNAQVNVTGMLLYHDGNFMQALEGPEAAVMVLYERIQKDPRHKAVTTLMKRPCLERQFSEWEMGFRNMTTRNLAAMPGYSHFLTYGALSESAADSIASEFLLTFKQGAR